MARGKSLKVSFKANHQNQLRVVSANPDELIAAIILFESLMMF
jgi:hypothetical protein